MKNGNKKIINLIKFIIKGYDPLENPNEKTQVILVKENKLNFFLPIGSFYFTECNNVWGKVVPHNFEESKNIFTTNIEIGYPISGPGSISKIRQELEKNGWTIYSCCISR